MLKCKINVFISDLGCLNVQNNKTFLAFMFFTSTRTVLNPSHFMKRSSCLFDKRDVLT